MFATQWFMCLFILTFPPETCARVWDLLFASGPGVLFDVSLRALRFVEKRLLAIDDPFDALMLLNTEMARMVRSVPADVVMRCLAVRSRLAVEDAPQAHDRPELHSNSARALSLSANAGRRTEVKSIVVCNDKMRMKFTRMTIGRFHTASCEVTVCNADAVVMRASSVPYCALSTSSCMRRVASCILTNASAF
jgi:hypothetical protein